MIIRKTPREIRIMRDAGRIVALTHQTLKPHLQPGITTSELDAIAERFIKSQGASPSFKGYNGFKGSICTSVNEEVVHGIPGNRVLKNGDIISIDIGALYNGYHGDSAWTYPIGTISSDHERLLQVTEDALYAGLEQIRPNTRLTSISHAIQQHVEKHGFSVVREMVGHGVGRDLHEDPDVPNYGPPNHGPKLVPGMVLAVEPMVNSGRRLISLLDDEWTIVTEDGSWSAHFEHTVAVTEDGFEILTKP
ncbi:type I methionyl aminopeptidase [Pullulanibacillus sp. KACC 23026]|uniref:type I methionyl aminopeptidase n=1 Tax=Pullulanibacillus sp. KACC 23026 TaxID=3028315 RepID=UPI0023B07628|nr:type I methionyl aminopeptidase [Pullulanibacillus sp. KACC 23026]WEG12652.1 type I methionyl aminopeptidase [Pullulanibacillus sp. KACC 23026]